LAKPPKCFFDTELDVIDWLLEPFKARERELFGRTSPELRQSDKHSKTVFKSLDTSIMNLADDIAYGVHDFEDGIALGLISLDHWKEVKADFESSWAKKRALPDFSSLTNQLFKKEGSDRRRAIGGVVNALITSARIETVDGFESTLLRYNVILEKPARRFLDALMDVTVRHIIKIQSVQSLEYRGRFMIMNLFEAIESAPTKLLSPSYARDYELVSDTEGKKRVICDYISGMTDAYATKIYQRLFVPGQGTVFEKL
jgi:dGTPase